MRDYCEAKNLDFSHLSKEQRIPEVAGIAESLMDSLRYVMPIIPVPVLAVVMIRAGSESLTSLEIVGHCDQLIDEMIERGAAMKADEKPRPRTLTNTLDMLKERKILLEQDDRYRVNPEYQSLLQYYANSIEHWWR